MRGAGAILLIFCGASCAQAPLPRRSEPTRRAPSRPEPRTEPLDPDDRRMNEEHDLNYRALKAREGLWYGTPGVRASGDLVGAIFRILADPSELLNFNPRGRASGPPPLDENMQRALNEMLRRYDHDR